jgi:hypothetical protein
MLADRDLTAVRGENVYSSKHAKGVVVRTRPYPGKLVKAGREVELVVSLGERRYRVPDVVKLPEEAAQQRIERAGFKVAKATEEHSYTVKKGHVIRQSPKAGSAAPKSAPVQLAVSKGKGPRRSRTGSSDEISYGLLVIRVPDGLPFQRLRARVIERDGSERTAYDRMHKPGERVEIRVSGHPGYKVRVYLDHKMIREVVCEW